MQGGPAALSAVGDPPQGPSLSAPAVQRAAWTAVVVYTSCYGGSSTKNIIVLSGMKNLPSSTSMTGITRPQHVALEGSYQQESERHLTESEVITCRELTPSMCIFKQGTCLGLERMAMCISASVAGSSPSTRRATTLSAAREYILGDGANITNAAVNDPRHQQLFTENVAHFPVYIRFQPRSRTDNWQLHRADVRFNGSLHIDWDTVSFVTNDPAEGIWLGIRSGLAVHLVNHSHDPLPGTQAVQ
jgi:hypothetical protein